MSLTTAGPSANMIRLATASPGTQSSRQETLAQFERLARRASGQKADFLLLPEAYLGGYPRGADFGCKIGGRTQEGRNQFAKYFREAIDLGDIVGEAGAGGLGKWIRRELGSTITSSASRGENSDKGKRGDGTREELERVARETGVFIVVGLVERAGGSLYCAVVYVCPARGVVGKRRKVLPTGSERLIWAQAAPATLQAVSTIIRGIRVNLAAAICWENYMPLLRQSLYAQNVNLYFAPTADERATWLPLMQTIGIEGRCFVVSSNMCIVDKETADQDTYSEREPTGESEEGAKEKDRPTRTYITRGGSSIVSPFGEVLAGPQWEVEAEDENDGIIYADVDLEDCVRGRLDFDAAGSYSRNDAFHFSVEGLDLDPLPYYA